jgi:anti-sigma B factor antagonist
MEIIIKHSGDISIAHFKGNLDTNTAPMAEEELKPIIGESGAKLIINLAETNYVSSAGLRIFLASAKKISANAGVFKLCAPNEVVKEILDISGFSTILDVRDSEEDAIANM